MSGSLKRVKSGLLQQDCYVREVCDLSRVLVPDRNNRYFYESIHEKVFVDEKGSPCLTHETIVEPYNITPDSVRSCADACNYKENPDLIGPPPSAGSVDLRAVQDVASMSLEECVSLVSDLSARFAQAQSQAQPQVQTDEKGGEKK